MLTDTWRASAANVARSAFSDRDVNADNARWLRSIAEASASRVEIFVGGVVGPQGDGYRPDESPSRDEAQIYHRQQIKELASAGVDFLVASTLPAVDEAIGMAKEMAATGLPFYASFVVRANGTILDGTPLADAVERLDALDVSPLCIGINCVHPSVLSSALELCSDKVRQRVRAFQANTSALDPEQLDEAEELQTEPPEIFASKLVRLLGGQQLSIIGGCCGTDERHLRALADAIATT